MTADDRDVFAIIDGSRSVPLDRHGAPGWTLAIGVLWDGTEIWGLVARSAMGDPRRGFPLSIPQHEFEGPIAGLRTRRNLALAGRADVPRCDAAMINCRPCRLPVRNPGDHCHVHHNNPPPEV